MDLVEEVLVVALATRAFAQLGVEPLGGASCPT